MKLQLTILAMSLALAGCGSDSSDTSVPTYTVSGKITAQNVDLQSKVCVDLNESFTCNDNEPSSEANARGEYSITSTKKSILTLPLLAEVDTGVAIQQASGGQSSYSYLVAPGLQKETGNNINGISSLLAGYMAEGITVSEANLKLKAQLSQKGIVINGDIQDHLSDSELAILEQNVVSTIKVLNDDNRASLLARLSANFDNNNVDYIGDVLVDAEINRFVEVLEGGLRASTTLNDTGVVLYFSDSSDIADVIDTQDSFPGQDADYGFDKTEVDAGASDGFKFIKLDSRGKELADNAATWSCVLDQRSGLIWESKKDDASSIQHKDRQFALEIPGEFSAYSKDIELATCSESGDEVCTTQDYVERINAMQLCGKSDWRLPTFHEFYNLIDFGETETNSAGSVYGLTYKYFPHQTLGSDYTEIGSVWTQSISHNSYTNSAAKGAFYYNEIGTLGGDRGYVSNLEIYSSTVDPEETYDSDSYHFPARLVSLQGK